ncbi:MAG: hypothetical protein ACOC8B_00410 [Gemmatimonadota bacterium]
MSRTLMLFAIGATVALTSACEGTPSGPAGDRLPFWDGYELPEPDTTLDPDRVVVGEPLATPCALEPNGGGLEHLRDRDEWALVDVFFGQPDGADGDEPSEEDVALVVAHFGRVLYAFNVPAVRARIVVSQVPDLVEEGFWVEVRHVPDARRYDVPLLVGFERPVRDADLERIEELGGRIESVAEHSRIVSVTLPDRSIPAVRELSGVDHVAVNGIACA